MCQDNAMTGVRNWFLLKKISSKSTKSEWVDEIRKSLSVNTWEDCGRGRVKPVNIKPRPECTKTNVKISL